MPKEKEQPPDDKEMALALNNMSRSLETGFECDFHDSVMKRVTGGIPLTRTMSLKLKEIYRKYFRDGEEDPNVEEDVDL